MPKCEITVGQLCAYEEGTMSEDEVIDMFSQLIKTGWIEHLQGSYGRAAEILIQSGHLTPDGDVACQHDYVFNTTCGISVCTKCNDHPLFARCYCGWARDGGNGLAQLKEMGETIDPD